MVGIGVSVGLGVADATDCEAVPELHPASRSNKHTRSNKRARLTGGTSLLLILRYIGQMTHWKYVVLEIDTYVYVIGGTGITLPSAHYANSQSIACNMSCKAWDA